MKKFRNLSVTICSFILLQLCVTVNVYAQADPYCDPDCNCYPNPPYAPCPIDGGVVALLVLGAAYGVKKVANHHKAAPQAL